MNVIFHSLVNENRLGLREMELYTLEKSVAIIVDFPVPRIMLVMRLPCIVLLKM